MLFVQCRGPLLSTKVKTLRVSGYWLLCGPSAISRYMTYRRERYVPFFMCVFANGSSGGEVIESSRWLASHLEGNEKEGSAFHQRLAFVTSTK
jgi:hypothetical protein